MTSAATKALMERQIATVGVDMEGWISLFAEDAVLEFPYLASVGMGASLQGRDAILRSVSSFTSGVRGFSIENPRIYEAADPDTVFAEYEVDGTIVATERRFHQSYFVRMHVRDGRISLMREYLDPIVVAAAVLPGGVADLAGRA